MLFRTVIFRYLVTERIRALVTLLGVALGVAVVLGIRLTNESSMRGFDTAMGAVSGRTALEITGKAADDARLWRLSSICAQTAQWLKNVIE